MASATVKVFEVQRFIEDSLKALGTPQKEAYDHATLLLQADLAGHFSHGLNRLVFYVNDIESKTTDPTAQPVVLKETVSTAWVDGWNALGATVGNFCMDLAIDKAKQTGIGWVSAKRSNHFGMAGWWARKAEKEGLIGLAFTNSSPIMVPTRGKEGALGTNPIGMCAPAVDGDYLLTDLATTAVAMGKIEMQVHKEEPIPKGWALGPDGQSTSDAKLAFDTGRLLPLGGSEETSGYKGYCLSAMVEAFCSGLSGSKASPQIRGWSLEPQADSPDLGQCFAAIDPDCFAPGFGIRIAQCLQYWRNMEPVDPSKPVLAPGDKEKNNIRITTERGTITYPKKQIETCHQLAVKLKVKPLEVEV